MKKILSLLTLSLLLLASCNTKNNDPAMIVGAMRSVNFAYHGPEATPTVTNGSYTFSINLDDNTASMAGAVALENGVNLLLQLSGLRSQFNSTTSEYVLTLPAPTQCGGHTIYELTVHLDARSQEMLTSYISMEVDDSYTVFSYMPILHFEGVTSRISRNGDEQTMTTIDDGIYRLNIDLENRLADLTIGNVIVLSESSSMTFKGLKLELTREGFRVTMPDDTESIREDNRSERLHAVVATFAARTGTFELDDCVIADSNSSLTIHHAEGRIN